MQVSVELSYAVVGVSVTDESVGAVLEMVTVFELVAVPVLDPSVAHAWLGGHFELVSIGVAEEVRGRGLGRELLGVLTSGLPHERLLLMATADESDPARRLYATDGWAVVGPGLSPEQVVLGKRQ